ncbi:MAG: hypothetical protein QOH37_3778 [Nocardioidaceae bacterium]|nr:hypothetical protein [Nocardioidaceae bacterium]
MSHNRARFVTACQQLLALAVVLAALTPAAGIVTLDVVGSGPAAGSTLALPTARTAAYTAEAVRASRVPTAPVRSHVREVQLTAATGVVGRTVPTTSMARVAAAPSGDTRLTSVPQKVTGFGEVGVTWAHGVSIPQTGIRFAARTRSHGAWSTWTDIPYDPEHGPDPSSREGRHARPGTDPVLVGKVGKVQVKAITGEALPADMKLAVIAPGHARHTTTERAAIDTSRMDGGTGQDSVYRAADPQPVTGSNDTASLAAAVFTPQPVIYSRAQWGADESIRGKSSLHYGDVHAGFVHHTVNANDYTRSEVPALMRSIYAYHVQSRGWSDIGYNYLIDRFGRIWEGRYGGVDRAVVGAHTLGFNDDSFAASAIGNYQITQPSEAMIQAYATLFAWKLSLHGVTASSTHQYVTSRYFQAINGHRDAAATLCPGQYLYDRIPDIRQMAAADQRGWTGRQLESNLASTPHPDLVVRRARDGELFVVPTGGLLHFPQPTTLATGLTGARGVLVSPDLTGDGVSDLAVRQADGSLAIRPGVSPGGFGPVARTVGGFRNKDQVLAPGDLNGDGRGDLIARNPATGRLLAWVQKSDGGFKTKGLGSSWSGYNLISSVGDVTGDGKVDLVGRDASGALWLFAGTGAPGFAQGVKIAGSFADYDVITGGGDWSGDGSNDLFVRSATSGKSWVLPGNGDGTFQRALGPFGRLAGATGLTAGNAAGSLAPDLVALSGDQLKVWTNPGTFNLGRRIDTGAKAPDADVLLSAGDWDRDGYGDVIIRTASSGDLYLLRGDGHGRLGAPTLLASGFGAVGKLAAVGDMTGDGYPDLMGQPHGGVMTIYPGKGVAGLRQAYPAAGSISGQQIGVGRWDDDGAPDSLFRKGASLTLYRGNGPGGLHSPTRLSIDTSSYDWVIGVSDLQLNGHPDLLVRQRGTGRLYAVPGTTTGFRAPIYLGQGMKGYDLAD